MKLLTLKQVISALKSLQKPYLELKVRSGFDEHDFGVFDPQSVGLKEASNEEKTEKALQWLQSYIQNFPGRTFVVYARTGRNVTKDATFGPFMFSQEYDGTEKPETKQPDNLQGLGGLDHKAIEGMGYIPKALLDAKIEAERNKNLLELEKEKNMHSIELLRAEMDAKFQLAGQWSPEHIDKLGARVTNLLGLIINKKGSGGEDLAGTVQGNTKELSPGSEVDNAKVEAVNSFAEELYNNASIFEIEKLRAIIRNKSNNNTTSEKEETIKSNPDD